MPAFALTLLAVRKGLRDTVLLGAIGLATTAVAGYVVFFLFFLLSYRIVRPIGNAVEVVSVVYVLVAFRASSREGWKALQPLLAPALLVFTSALMFQAWTFAYEGLEKPLITPMFRFSQPLPGDNSLPYQMLHSMMNLDHRIPSPLVSEWLSSDRPPLQTAIALSEYSALLAPVILGYQMLSVLLQSLWIFGLWLLLYALEVRGRATACVLTAALFTNFALVQSVFVWPKMLAVSYMLGFAALLLGGRLRTGTPFGTASTATATALLAWAFLSHGGSLFALLGLLPVALLFHRPASIRRLAAVFVLAGILFVPWTLYQKYYDPPGNRILKIHLAGVYPIDSRPFGQTILDSYRALSRQQLIANKTSNLEFVFHRFEFWHYLRQLIAGPSRVAAARAMNNEQFFHFGSTVGILVIGLPGLLAGLARRYRSVEWQVGFLCWTFVILANVLWCLVMFGPESTFVHQGTYVTVILAFAGGVLGLWSVSEWLAYAVTVLQVILFGFIHIVMLAPAGGVLHYGNAFLAALALMATAYLFHRVATYSPAPNGR